MAAFSIPLSVCVLAFAASTFSADNAIPGGIFAAWTVAVVTGVLYWHATRPEMVFEEDGLRIGGHSYPWKTIRSLELRDWRSVVVVETLHDGEGPKRFTAVKASPRSI